MDRPEEQRSSRRARSVDAASIQPAEFTYEAAPVSPRVALWKRAINSVLRFARRNLYTLVPFAILVAALGYYYFQYQHLLAQNSPQQTQAQVQRAVDSIEKLMYVPSDSGAQLATISDKTKLAGQAFFAHAENGDELVLFPAAQEAVLYRPSTNKIIQVGPYTGTANSTGASAAQAPFKASTSTATKTK